MSSYNLFLALFLSIYPPYPRTHALLPPSLSPQSNAQLVDSISPHSMASFRVFINKVYPFLPVRSGPRVVFFLHHLYSTYPIHEWSSSRFSATFTFYLLFFHLSTNQFIYFSHIYYFSTRIPAFSSLPLPLLRTLSSLPLSSWMIKNCCA